MLVSDLKEYFKNKMYRKKLDQRTVFFWGLGIVLKLTYYFGLRIQVPV
jgi:hypothetical protein